MFSNSLKTPVKTPKRRNEPNGDSVDQWGGYAVAVVIAIAIIVALGGSSPRTGFYVLSVFLLLLVLVKLAIALVRSITADTD
jgi:high-affinity Fe2+/Pb2+ permease